MRARLQARARAPTPQPSLTRGSTGSTSKARVMRSTRIAAAAAAAALPGSGAGDDVASPCSDPTCLRCRPSRARPRPRAERREAQGADARGDEKRKPPARPTPTRSRARGSSPEVLALATSAVASSSLAPRPPPPPGRPPGADGVPPRPVRARPRGAHHRRDGVARATLALVVVPETPDAAAAGGAAPRAMMTRGGRHSSRCYCAPLWREISLSRPPRARDQGGARAEHDGASQPSQGRRLVRALTRPRRAQGREWSAVYLWRNGFAAGTTARRFRRRRRRWSDRGRVLRPPRVRVRERVPEPAPPGDGHLPSAGRATPG